MRLICFILSVVVFFISLYFFILKVPEIVTFNDTIYILLLVVLMAICVLGVLINIKVFDRARSSRAFISITNNFYKNKK
jgi:hypothetical protein